ncbi:extracellular signal-regulated kinase 2 [Fasciolopsis buskii]|uniref:Mitogen-activated protein kinase n=1 Tax=Fasciolopsis buskii TaxID=27845 RepID=A0A8E0VJ13_9TREM|nr:extracellular signal-regulated kinase 2 [Fasciolopsis buski]
MSECDIENTILKHYDIVKRLGKGAYGIVWRAKNKKNGNTVALKKIFDAFRNQTDAQRTFREITFLQAFAGHPNIIRLLNVIKADNNKDIYLVFEHMETDLHNCIKKGNVLKDVHKKYIFYQLLRAVKYLHSANVIHRDLKPSNILLDSDCLVKVCDFGLTRSLTRLHDGVRGSVESFSDTAVNSGDPELTEYVATRWYRAPEILLASSRYTKFVDMWSLGCILGEMLRGKPLFPGSSTINQIERIVSVVDKPSDEDIASLHSEYGRSILAKAFQKPRRPIETFLGADVDRNAVDLLKKLLILNPSKRLTVEEAINHSYVKKFRDPSSEIVMDHDVTPPLSDDLQLSVADYQQKLYEIILEKKAQRRIQRILRTMKLEDERSMPDRSVSLSLKFYHQGDNI